MKIAVVAPSRYLEHAAADAAAAVAAGAGVELAFHPQCFLSHGHFAGNDEARAEAFVAVANDPQYNGVWFARGGYGACRILNAIDRLDDTAGAKKYLGFSDAGFLLAALDRRGIGTLAHGPMVADIGRAGGTAAIERALGWFHGTAKGQEPSGPAVALNATVAASLCGTGHMPDLTGRVLMLEEIGEYEYRLDRLLFQIATSFGANRPAGLRLGRVSEVPVNNIDFGQRPEAIVRHWCAVAGVPYLGTADIGHDAGNKVVPFR